MSGCEGVAPSMWHILAIGWLWMSRDVRELRHLCGICWLGWLMDVGRYEGVTLSMWGIPSLILANRWELRHLCPKKAA